MYWDKDEEREENDSQVAWRHCTLSGGDGKMAGSETRREDL